MKPCWPQLWDGQQSVASSRILSSLLALTMIQSLVPGALPQGSRLRGQAAPRNASCPSWKVRMHDSILQPAAGGRGAGGGVLPVVGTYGTGAYSTASMLSIGP